MEKTQFKHGIVVLGLMAMLAAVLPFQPDLRVIDSSDVSLALPERVGDYVGQDVFFCQNESCLRSFKTDELAGGRQCLSCGSDLDSISLGEKGLLPADTQIARKEYQDGMGSVILVSVVLNGREQKSIHRPQQCLPAQGHVIDGSHVESVGIPKRLPLDIMLLDTRRVSGSGSTGRLGCYAYWFAGGGHETPRHLERLMWMSSDMLFRGQVSRWAYVGVQTSRDGRSDRHVKRIQDFVSKLYPLIRPPVPQDSVGALGE